jgi:hypothetical protein
MFAGSVTKRAGYFKLVSMPMPFLSGLWRKAGAKLAQSWRKAHVWPLQ